MTETENATEKLLIIATHGAENPEKATLPFVMGNAAVALDVQTTIVLQSNGVLLAKKGCYEHVFAAGFPALQELVDSFIEFGGRILVCIPCIEERKIVPGDLIDGIELGKAGKVVMATLEADATMSY